MAKLRFGTGGIPLTAKSGVAEGINRIAELELEHMELEFVQNVYVKPEAAPDLRKLAEEKDVTLSVHGSYYVNLASVERPKWHASISRVNQAAAVGDACGAKSVTYHSGFRVAKDEQGTKERVTEGTAEILSTAKEKGLMINIAPELTGKPGQYGDLEELIALILDMRAAGHEHAACCIDFAHKYARSNGRFNSYDEFMQIIDALATNLGSEFIESLHMHVSGIDYSEKGETHHLLFLPDLAAYQAEGIDVPGIEKFVAEMDAKRLKPNQFKWQELMKALKQSGVGGYVVCESPILELDALLMQKYYLSL